MSTLLVDELYNGIEFVQPVRIYNDINLSCVRPWIYKHGTLLTGTLTLEIFDGEIKLNTSTIHFSDINSGINGLYAHGFIRFDFNSMVLRVPDGEQFKEYLFKFYMNNYTNNANGFIGLCRQFENELYDVYGDGSENGSAVNSYIAPTGLELYNIKMF